MLPPVSPYDGDPPTGEPDAGDPPVRFGGREDRLNRSSLPRSDTRLPWLLPEHGRHRLPKGLPLATLLGSSGGRMAASGTLRNEIA